MARELKATDKQIKAKKERGAVAVERRVTHSLNHPVRLDALSILIERVSSPKEIAKMLRIPLGTASFHVGELFADDVVELVETKQRRGAVEHFYRAKQRPELSEQEWRAMPMGTRREIAALTLRAIAAEGLTSLRHGRMEADDELHLAWKVVKVDAEGKRELSEAQIEMFERVEEIRGRIETRISTGGEACSTRVVAVMGFERGKPGGQPSDDSLGEGAFEAPKKRRGKS